MHCNQICTRNHTVHMAAAAGPTKEATADTVLRNTTSLAHLGLVFKFIMKLPNTDISYKEQ